MDFTQDENGSVIKSRMEISFTYFPGQSIINNFFPTSFTVKKYFYIHDLSQTRERNKYPTFYRYSQYVPYGN